MFRDIVTVIRKEVREMLSRKAGFKGGRTGLLIFAGVFGILMPLQNGAKWLTSPIALVAWAWVPVLLTSSIVADSFAGERERHTLETLLASRLPDRAILLGKIGASVSYSWGLTMACLLMGVITVNIAHGKGHFLFYPALTAVVIVISTFLVSLLSSGLGVLISLRASSVREAQQTFSIAFLILMVPLFLVPVLPAGVKAAVKTFFTNLNLSSVMIGTGIFLIVANIIILIVADARFKRNKLILD